MSEVSVYKKQQANALVCRAKIRGEIIRQPCVECGAKPAVAHHEDYAKPMEVVWLCHQCHANRHKELRGRNRIPKNVSVNKKVLAAIEVYVAGHKSKGCRNVSELTENLWISFLRKRGVALPELTKEIK